MQHLEHPSTSVWFQSQRMLIQPRVRLFCFPFAGGSAAIYQNWHRLLPNDVEVIAVQLPGRASRLAEPACSRLDDLVSSLYEAIEPWTQYPYAFFGHSMGGRVAYELSCRLADSGGVTPEWLFISGCGAPQFPRDKDPVHHLPTDQFLEEIRELNGTPDEILANDELMELVIPVLRADFELCETWEYHERLPLKVPMVVFGGLQDSEIPANKLEGWKEHAGGFFRRHMFPGDHFFLSGAEQQLLMLLARYLIST